MNKAIEFERSKPVRRRLMIKKRLGRGRFRARKAARQFTEAQTHIACMINATTQTPSVTIKIG